MSNIIPFCKVCQQLASGNCGQHGVVANYALLDEQTTWMADIIESRDAAWAEIDRLKAVLHAWQEHLSTQHGVTCNWPFRKNDNAPDL